MPQWVHDRAQHIRKKNPEMPESESWAIATNQYKKKKGPSSKSKKASANLALLNGFSDELEKIAIAGIANVSTMGPPKISLKTIKPTSSAGLVNTGTVPNLSSPNVQPPKISKPSPAPAALGTGPKENAPPSVN